MFFRRFVRRLELSAALRTGFEFEFDGLIDLLFGKGGTEMLLVSFLTTDFLFASSVFVFGRFDDVGGGGLEELPECFLSRAISSRAAFSSVSSSAIRRSLASIDGMLSLFAD